MAAHVHHLAIDFAATQAMSSLYRTANSVRSHLTRTVLREHDLTWTGFVVLWIVWIWEGRETRDVADSAGISKGTLTGVVHTLQARGWLTREPVEGDKRLVLLQMTPTGIALMEEIYPAFNAAEADAVGVLSPRAIADLTRSLRRITNHLEQDAPN